MGSGDHDILDEYLAIFMLLPRVAGFFDLGYMASSWGRHVPLVRDVRHDDRRPTVGDRRRPEGCKTRCTRRPKPKAQGDDDAKIRNLGSLTLVCGLCDG